MTRGPSTCGECGQRRSGPFAALEDWEAAHAHGAKVGAKAAAAAKGARLIAEQRDAAVAELGDWRIPALELRTAAVRLDELSVAGVSGWLAPHPRHPRACAWFEAWETLREAISRFPA